jgi:hypothetical protein
VKLTPEEIQDRALIIHKRKASECKCPVCGRDCGNASGLHKHRNVCKPWVDNDYREQYE